MNSLNTVKFLQILQTFSREERINFLNLAQSPHWNPNRNAVALLEKIMEQAPNWEANQLLPQQVFQAAYPKRAFSRPFLNKQLNILVRLSERFLVQGHLSQDQIERQWTLLCIWQERQLERLFWKAWHDLDKTLEDRAVQDATYHWWKFRLASLANEGLHSSSPRSQHNYLEEMDRSLDYFYWIRKIQMACARVNRGMILRPTEPEAPSHKTVSISSPPAYLGEEPYFRIWMEVLHILQTQKMEDTQKILHRLATLKMPFSEYLEIIKYMQNALIRSINQGERAYFSQLMELYEEQLKLHAAHPEKQRYLPHEDFKNMVTIGLQLHRLAWVKSLIQDYQANLAPEVRESALAYNLANLQIYQGHYEEAIRQLLTIRFEDPYYAISARTLLLKCYYESEDFDPLLNQVEAFRYFLLRDQILPRSKKQALQNFLLHLKKIVKLRMTRDYMRIEKWEVQWQRQKDRLAEKKLLLHGHWLSSLLQEMHP